MNKSVKHFTDLIVWQKAHQLFLDLLNDLEKCPKNIAVRIIGEQLIRSIGSISANIAEGFNSQSTKQYLHYLDIVKRTTAESENWYYKLKDARYLANELALTRIKQCDELSRMVQGLITSLSLKSRS